MNTTTRGEELNPIQGEPDAAVVEFVVADTQTDVADLFAVIQTRADTVTVVLQEVLRTRPPPHWGIND